MDMRDQLSLQHTGDTKIFLHSNRSERNTRLGKNYIAKVEESNGKTTSSSLTLFNIKFTCCTGEYPNTVWYL